jgi:UDPglucose 6-dehydrogenase
MMKRRYKIGVVGAGYVGLTNAACFSELGHKVVCYDKEEKKIKNLREGIVPIWEPGLDELIKKNIGKNLFFTDSPDEIYPESEVIFICVGTPQSQDGSPDMSYVELCSIEISNYLENYKIIVEKSTVPVKTADWIKRTISLYNPQAKFDIVSNPEFLREGSAVYDFFNPDRVVIGTESEMAKEVMLDIYNDDEFKCPKVITDVKTAEVIKHASNSFLALKISYINMIADFCEKVGVDVEAVAEGMGFDKRIGRAFLKAGVGWGGSCFPKDIKAFIKMAKDNQISFSILEEAYKVNETRIDVFIKKIKDTPRLLNEGALLQIYDPKAMENTKKVIPPSDQVFYASSAYEAAKGTHAIAIITEWDEFKNVNLQEIKKLMITPIIVDGRNIFEPKKVRELGFLYFSMGRP